MSSNGSIGIVYNPRSAGSMSLVQELSQELGLGESAWIVPTRTGESDDPPSSISLLITVGGDGTILWATQFAAPREIPILGVNLGRVGFMTELRADEAVNRVRDYLDGKVWVEERSMLQATVISNTSGRGPGHQALNDVVVGRTAISRLVHLEVKIDDALLTTYRADAVILATATGSTGYSISAGGPVLHPESRDMLLNPVATHLGLHSAIVLAPESVVQVAIRSDYVAALSVDGRADMDLAPGDVVEIVRSPYIARFLRANPPNHFYSVLTDRLNPETRTTSYAAAPRP